MILYCPPRADPRRPIPSLLGRGTILFSTTHPSGFRPAPSFRQYCAGGTKRVPDELASMLRIVADATTHPLSASELADEDRHLLAVGAANAKKADAKERDVVRVVHESRARRSRL